MEAKNNSKGTATVLAHTFQVPCFALPLTPITKHTPVKALRKLETTKSSDYAHFHDLLHPGFPGCTHFFVGQRTHGVLHAINGV